MGISKRIKPQPNKLTPEKAYVLGFLFGEASLYRNNQFSVTQKNREMLIMLSNFIVKVYGKNFRPNIPKEPNHGKNKYITYICGKELVKDLQRFAKGFGHKNWGLNKKGFNDCWNNPIVAAYYIRGILDGEGKKPRQRKGYIEKETIIGSKNLDGLWQIVLLLEKHWKMIPLLFEIKKEEYYHLRISGEDFIKLAKGTEKAPAIGFYHPERREMLLKAVNQKIKQKSYSLKYFLETWRLRKEEGLGHIRIARKLGIKESAVGCWIYLGHRPPEIQKIAKRITRKINGRSQVTPHFLVYLAGIIIPIAKKMNGELNDNVRFLLARIIGVPIEIKYWARKGKYSEEVLKCATELAQKLLTKGYNKSSIAKKIEQKFGINANTFRRHFCIS